MIISTEKLNNSIEDQVVAELQGILNAMLPKKLYFIVSDDDNFIDCLLKPEECMNVLFNNSVIRSDEAFQYTVKPVWLTDEEYNKHIKL